MYKNKFFRISLVLFILITIYIFISATSYSNAVIEDISGSVLRLHVIANSNSNEDQKLKYIVRDNILNYMNQISLNCSSKSEAISLLNTHLEDFQNIAENTIKENGFNYNVSVCIDNCAFPTKTYGDISLPAGYYDALKIEIGNASGQNWWCVMFPPLCFVDVTSGVVPDESKSIIQDNLSEEEYSIISNQSNPDIQFKFSLIEMFQNFKMANK